LRREADPKTRELATHGEMLAKAIEKRQSVSKN
jgi:hypothetical protein